MGLIPDGLPHCKRCGTELEDVPEICPHCGFHPRDRGLKVSGYVLVGVLVLVVAAIVLAGAVPEVSAYLVLAAGLGFLLASTIFVVSFVANPYRLGGIFR